MHLYEITSKYSKPLLEVYDQKEVSKILDIMLESITKMGRAERITNQYRALTLEEQTRFDEVMGKVLQSHPLQYLLGEAWFSGVRLSVDENVLIPRPETDELVEWISKDVATTMYAVPTFKILDIGTGSGCIPLGLKKKLFKVELTGIDISEKALEVAKKNSDAYLANIEFKQVDFLNESKWEALDKYNVIVSNPPYVREMEKAKMHKNVLDFEPSIALFVPDADPFLFYKKIAQFSQTHLAENGYIYVEINEALGQETVELFTSYGYATQLKKDMQGKNRMIKAWNR